MKIIDLSQKIYDKMPYHPYDEEPIVVKDKTFEKDGYNNTQISVGMHIGTHIDAPKHLFRKGRGIETYDLSHFMGRGCVIDVRGEDEILLRQEHKDKIINSDIVLVYTGYGECFEKKKYYGDSTPVLSEEFAQYLIEQQTKMVGMDLPSPDRYPFAIHKMLLSNDVLILENLTNLNLLLNEKNIKISAMPIKIDAEASLTRAIAIIDS